ncbi:SH3 domain-containing protein [Tenacibaculum agarivorans]|uniref:SH3 domain-containing protein n=1 Tax=Tenacibaculum agarivorans TaxID=1908389 RepID=UPI00094B95DF|nr:SH3 domain-containing protein [Tenacibaculum agarivorans]
MTKESKMKKYVLLSSFLVLVACLLLVLNHKKETQKKAKYSNSKVCYVAVKARCTGSIYCRACKNCSRCKYCNSGGACGVCTDKRKRRTTTPEEQYTTAPSEVSLTTKIAQVKKYNTPLRSGADESFYVIQNLNKYEVLKVLKLEKEWFKVKVIRTDAIGFIHSKYIMILNN